MKRAISFLLFLSLVTSFLSPLSVLAVGDPVSMEAEILNAHGIILGSGDDLRLGDDFTVEQLLTVLARLQGKDAVARNYPTSQNFSDVPATRWSAPYTAWAKATGISQGKPDGTIGYSEKVTAQRLAAFLLRVMGYTNIPYSETMTKAAALGFVSPTQIGTEPLLRGTVAKIVYDATQVVGPEAVTIAERIGIPVKAVSLSKSIPSPVPFVDVGKATSMTLPISFTDFMGSSDGGMYDGYHVFVVKDEDIPVELPSDIFFRFGGIGAPASSLFDSLLADSFASTIVQPFDMRNGRGRLYDVTAITIYSPSQNKMWYDTFSDNIKEGSLTLRLRELDCAAYADNRQVRSAAILAMKDDVSAATFDGEGILNFDPSKWSVLPAYFVSYQFNAKDFMTPGQLASHDIYLHEQFKYMKSIQKGQSIHALELNPDLFTLLVYLNEEHRIVGFRYLSADEMAIAEKLRTP